MDSDQTFHVKTLFYQGSYAACHEAIDRIESPSFQLILFSARSLISLNKPKEAIEILNPFLSDQPAARSLNLLARLYLSSSNQTQIEKENITEEAEGLAEEILDEDHDGIDSILRVTLSTVLHLMGNTTLAIFLLKQGVQLKSLESVSLLIYLYLTPKLNRPDLARMLYKSVKVWADDAILLQMTEAWIGTITGSGANTNGKESGGYQSAFYVFDEISSSHSSSDSSVSINLTGLNGKAVTQLAMGHLEEAQANLIEALKSNPKDETTLANSIVASGHADSAVSTAAEHLQQLRSINPSHPLIIDLDRQSALFDEAASKFVASKA
ncbi:coatomer epsilon subunit-domain-containing protein [Melampsora americana]|nr:coatomer epsilon subunit-domain-containing protein [Melampsora americana]